jgi:CRP/FNR family transcriptional regulator, nitrogen oxide reductase regulator
MLDCCPAPAGVSDLFSPFPALLDTIISMEPQLIWQQLAQTPLFNGLSSAELEEIYHASLTRRVERDGFFFFQGDEAEAIFVLVSGRVKITQLTPEGQQVVLRVVGPWTLYGGVVMAQEERYPASAEAVEASQALIWHKEIIMGFIKRFPMLAINAMQLMSGHIQEFQDRYRELATQRVERRLARTLVRLAAQTGRKIPDGILIDMALTRQDLAEMTGTTLYTVSRILSQWESQGLILGGRERVVIRYPHGLVGIAEDLPPSDSKPSDKAA